MLRVIIFAFAFSILTHVLGCVSGYADIDTGDVPAEPADFPGTCEPVSPFVGSNICAWPSIDCCDMQGADIVAHCIRASAGTKPQPVMCDSVPSIRERDFHACIALEPSSIPCAWGSQVIVCCEPLSAGGPS